jgi:hypothetical protein
VKDNCNSDAIEKKENYLEKTEKNEVKEKEKENEQIKEGKDENGEKQETQETIENPPENIDVEKLNVDPLNNSKEETTGNHNRCVPLNVYKKVYNDKIELLKKVNNFNLIMKQKESEIMNLQLKLKKYENEKNNEANILLKQEKYVKQLNKKIEKLESIIIKHKEEIINKENEILESKEKFEEYQNNLEHSKNIFKLDYQKQIEQKNEKINFLSKEIEIKNNKLEKFEKKYKFLQEKYLKTLNEKNILSQENVYNPKKLSKSSVSNKLFKTALSKNDSKRLITFNPNPLNQLDNIIYKIKDRYDNNLFPIEIDEKENKESDDSENINILPDINLKKSRNLDNRTKSKVMKVQKKKMNLKSDFSGDEV